MSYARFAPGSPKIMRVVAKTQNLDLVAAIEPEAECPLVCRNSIKRTQASFGATAVRLRLELCVHLGLEVVEGLPQSNAIESNR